MKIPFEGKVNARLVEKRFSGKVFYGLYDQQSGKGYGIYFGFLRFNNGNNPDINSPMIRYFDKDNNLGPFSRCTSWGMIFDSHEEAKKELKLIKDLYSNGFSEKPFIRLCKLKKNKQDMIKIESDIKRILSLDDRFNGLVRFSDVSAKGIQVTTDYSTETIEYDFSNKNDVVINTIEKWLKFANKHHGK